VLECSKRGWALRHTSWYDARTKRTHDLFTGFDGLAFPSSGGMVALQWTSAANAATRVKKLEALPETEMLLRVPARVVVWGWREDGRLREIEITSGPP
jgi:hypothetical protein